MLVDTGHIHIQDKYQNSIYIYKIKMTQAQTIASLTVSYSDLFVLIDSEKMITLLHTVISLC